MSKLCVLPPNYENEIQELIELNFKKFQLLERYPNPLLKKDVLDVLDQLCTVVYYPLEDSNNGFHITDVPSCLGDKHFVFINTAQTTEKQVFTAAHELGHIWKVDSCICDKMGIETANEELRERIISRFAAVLLMPEKNFVPTAMKVLEEVEPNGDKLDFKGILKFIVLLMYTFYVPRKAVVLRLFELGMLSEESTKILLGNGAIPLDVIEITTRQICLDLGYEEFIYPNRKKYIEGLSDLLNDAEKSKVISLNKIENIRKKFDLNKSISVERKEVFTLNTTNGSANNA